MDKKDKERDEEEPKQASWVKSSITIAGLQLNYGDKIDLGLGRQRILGIFRGFDRILYAFHIETEDGNMVIPYKNIKYLRKPK